MRILIVEDHKPLADLLARYLRPLTSDPSRITIVHNMSQAMQFLSGIDPVDLVALDLGLPDSSTQETLEVRIKEIRAVKPNCLLMVVTGTARPEDEQRAIMEGADGFIHKNEACRNQETFLGTLSDIGRSILRGPSRYQKNIPLLESLTERIRQHTESQLNQSQS